MRFGYARTSGADQNLDGQLALLNEAICERIVQEQVSGKSTDGRDEFKKLVEFVRSGDEIVVTRIDRFARSVLDFCVTTATLERKGVRLIVLQQGIDTGGATGKMVAHLLAVIAEYELGLLKSRQMEGIRIAQKAGKYRGRGRSFDPDEIVSAFIANPSEKITRMARKIGCSRHTVYRILREKGIPVNETA